MLKLSQGKNGLGVITTEDIKKGYKGAEMFGDVYPRNNASS